MANVQYYATLYEGRATDPTETTVLTPAVGASHSDDFKVATAVEAGWKNYLDRVDGRRGQIDPLMKKTDTGRMTLLLVDKRVAETNNAQRWVAAFFGDDDALLRGLGHKVVVQADYGSGKVDYFTGRVERFQLVGKNAIAIDLRDMNDDLRGLIFTEYPHASISYATREMLFPAGFLDGEAYNGFATRPKAAAVVRRLPGMLSDQATAYGAATGEKVAFLTAAIHPRLIELVPYQVPKAGFPTGTGLGAAPTAAGQKVIGVYFTHTSGAYSGQTGRYQLDKILYLTPRQAIGFTFHALRKADGTPDTGHAEYVPIPAAGVTGNLWIKDVGPPTPSSPIYLNDVNPGDLMKDIFDGKFGPLTSAGAVRFTYGYDATALSAIQNDATLLDGRHVITKPVEIMALIQERLCVPWTLAYYVDAAGDVVVVDMRFPASLAGIVTLTDEDDAIVAADDWSVAIGSVVTRVRVLYYADVWHDPDADYAADARLAVEEKQQPAIGVDFGRESTIGEESELEIDATGFRYSGVGEYFGLVTLRRQAVERYVEELIDGFRFPFGIGAVYATIPCKRTANVLSLELGDWVGGDFDALPNPATNARGGARIYQVVGIYDVEGARHLTLLDYGRNIASTAPSIGTLSLVGGNEKHEATCTVTLGGGDPARVEYAVTAAGGTIPAATDADWRFFTRLTTTGAVRLLAGANQRIWVRARTESGDTKDPKLPSAWVFPSAGNGVTTTALTAPSSLGNSVDGGNVLLTWTPGETSELNGITEVYAETPAPGGNPTTLITELPPESTSYQLRLGAGATGYKAGVRHRDSYGGVSTMATTTFTTGTLNTAPDMAAPPGILWGLSV